MENYAQLLDDIRKIVREVVREEINEIYATAQYVDDDSDFDDLDDDDAEGKESPAPSGAKVR